MTKKEQNEYREALKWESDIKAPKESQKAPKEIKYVLYKHTNSKGDVYIGSGESKRPYGLRDSVRSANWIEAFKGSEVFVEVLNTFNRKWDARIAERQLIQSIGLENLVNINN